MKIALDVIGGDNAPLSTIEGAFSYLDDQGDSAAELILLGDKDQIESSIRNLSHDKSDITIQHTTETVGMNERSSRIFKEKPNSSLVQSVQLVRDGKAQAVVSAGNTGALLASSLFLIGKIPGIRRPAFAPFIPTNKEGFILCDAGANSDNKPEHLLQFAFMASAYIKHLDKIHRPKIGLLNIGIEKNKGNQLIKQTFPLLEHNFKNFIGNIESRTLFDNKVDIVVCDGFTGNIVLKLIEGTVNNMVKNTMKSINSHSLSKIIKPVLSPVLKDIKKSLDYEEHGGTPLLGVNGIVMKCHGASNDKAIENALLNTQKSYENNLIRDMNNLLSKNRLKLID